MKLLLDSPIELWDEAAPLGNGLMGGLLYGGGSRLRLALDRGDLWDERAAARVRRKDFTWAEWVRLKSEGKWDEIAERFDDPYLEVTPTKIPAGGLELTLDPAARAARFFLNTDTGLGGVELAAGRGTVECFFSAAEPLAVLRFPGGVLRDWRFQPPPVLREKLGYAAPETGETGELRWVSQLTPEGLRYAVAGLAAEAAGEVVLFLTIASSVTDGADPLAAATDRLRLARERGFAALLAPHLEWWRAFQSVSSVALPDPAAQRQYELVRYFLGAGSRTGAPPLPLQGVWTAPDDLPPWKGDYHHDLNTQMTYLSYLASGHFEAGRVFFDFMWERLPVFRAFARDFYGTPGAMFPAVMSAAGTALCGWPMYSLMPQANASWVGWMFYRHWLYTRDAAFLRERAWPFCRELGECLAALLKPDADGCLKMEMSSSSEINDNTPGSYLPPNTNYDRDGLEALFDALGAMAAELGLDAEAERWRGLAARLDARWVDPETRELLLAAGMPLKESHRHHAHLMSIHPYGQISVEGSEAERAVVQASLAALERLGVEAWVGFSHAWAACLHARAGDGEAACRQLGVFCDAFVSRNGFHLNFNQRGIPGQKFHGRPFTLEANFIAMEAVHEMLLQSWGGVLRIFPALPKAWADVAFRDLRAEGGWRVTAERRGGRLTRLEIAAAAGGVLRLRAPTPQIAVNGRRLTPGPDGTIAIPTSRGDVIKFDL